MINSSTMADTIVTEDVTTAEEEVWSVDPWVLRVGHHRQLQEINCEDMFARKVFKKHFNWNTELRSYTHAKIQLVNILRKIEKKDFWKGQKYEIFHFSSVLVTKFFLCSSKADSVLLNIISFYFLLFVLTDSRIMDELWKIMSKNKKKKTKFVKNKEIKQLFLFLSLTTTSC